MDDSEHISLSTLAREVHSISRGGGSERVRVAMAYGSVLFSSTLINTVFNYYYVELFMSVYGLDNGLFYTGQVVFAIWNAVNDPLFGYFNDHSDHAEGRRIPAIRWGGPIWAALFLLPWFPWSLDGGSWLAGLHFTVSLCAFDGLLTYVLICHCSLLADLTVSNAERTTCNLFSHVFSIAGTGLGMVLGYAFWDEHGLLRFRIFCVVAACVSAGGFYLSSRFLSEKKAEVVAEGAAIPLRSAASLPGTPVTPATPGTPSSSFRDQSTRERASVLWNTTRQILSSRNLWLFIVLNFAQFFNSAFMVNFLPLFNEHLFEYTLPAGLRSFVMVSGSFFPQVLIILGSPYVSRVGVYRVVLYATYIKVGLSALMYVIGVATWQLWAALFVVNNLFMAASFGLYNILVAHIIDEDRWTFRRPRTLSAMVHGTQSLFVKPAQSLAPMVGVYLLGRAGFDGSGDPLSGSAEESRAYLQSVLYSFMCIVPAVCGLVQLLAWQRYSLHGKELRHITSKLRDLDDFPEHARATDV